MDGPRDVGHTEWSQPDRERRILYIIYMWNLKIQYKWSYLQNRSILTDTENKLTVAKGEGRRDKLGVWN